MSARRNKGALRSTALAFVLAGTILMLAQQPPAGPATPPPMRRGQHPGPQPRPAASQVTVSGDGNTTTVITGQSVFPICNPASLCDPFLHPPGTNMLPTIYTNMSDGNGVEMPNTLPSTPTIPYNLQDAPQVSIINVTSPQDDLRSTFDAILTNATNLLSKSLNAGQAAQREKAIHTAIQFGLDVLEGNPLPNRAYSGLPLLHYKGGEKVQVVDPNTKNVDIHQVWYDTHIESDTAFLDVRGVHDVPWTITYTVDVLNRGHDDFSPFAMYFDDPSITPGMMPPPHVAMDQTFFNMEDGTRTVFKIKMAPGKYYNLTYSWGWRAHPPRVQATENGCKTTPFGPVAPTADCAKTPNTLIWWERSVFFKDGQPDKDYGISRLSKHAPEMRMWKALRDARTALTAKRYQTIVDLFARTSGKIGVAQEAWRDWRDRTRLPSGLPPQLAQQIRSDKENDLSLVYLANTIYAHFADGGRMDFPKWTQRGTWLKVALYNGDYFDHGYQNVDFGGARGWENQFKSSVKVAGSGCWFTFGRVHWWMNIPSPPLMKNKIPGTVTVPAATPAATPDAPDTFGRHYVRILYNYEPSRRVRFYQFDPVHHDVAIFSVH